ncbi:hypothetical protein BC826DRAFT_665323 [Russula brevipes]|nr:hypothetical protein BC826DRAFT_665323 [Russula brevipes]
MKAMHDVLHAFLNRTIQAPSPKQTRLFKSSRTSRRERNIYPQKFIETLGAQYRLHHTHNNLIMDCTACLPLPAPTPSFIPSAFPRPSTCLSTPRPPAKRLVGPADFDRKARVGSKMPRSPSAQCTNVQLQQLVPTASLPVENHG